MSASWSLLHLFWYKCFAILVFFWVEHFMRSSVLILVQTLCYPYDHLRQALYGLFYAYYFVEALGYPHPHLGWVLHVVLCIYFIISNSLPIVLIQDEPFVWSYALILVQSLHFPFTCLGQALRVVLCAYFVENTSLSLCLFRKSATLSLLLLFWYEHLIVLAFI